MKTRNIIENNYSKFTKTEMRLANFIMEDDGESILELTLADLSQRLKIGEATIIRFCKKNDFSGYQQLKLAIAIDFANSEAQDNQVEPEGINDKILVKMLSVVQQTHDAVILDSLNQSVQMISESQNLFFYGVGSSGFAAEIAEERFIRVGKMCKSITEAHLQLAQSAIVGSKDLIVAISLSGRTGDLLGSLSVARENGCQIVAVTNNPNSPIAKIADCVVVTSGYDNPFVGGNFDSIVSQLYVLYLMCANYSYQNRQQSFTYQEKVARTISERIIHTDDN